MSTTDIIHAAWTCFLIGWTAWVLTADRRARRIVSAAEARARVLDIEAQSAARRVVAAGVQRAIRLSDGRAVVRLR